MTLTIIHISVSPLSNEPTSVPDLQCSPTTAVDLDNLEGWDSILSELGLNDDNSPYTPPNSSTLISPITTTPSPSNSPPISNPSSTTSSAPPNPSNPTTPTTSSSSSPTFTQCLPSPSGKPLIRVACFFKESISLLLSQSPSPPLFLRPRPDHLRLQIPLLPLPHPPILHLHRQLGHPRRPRRLQLHPPHRFRPQIRLPLGLLHARDLKQPQTRSQIGHRASHHRDRPERIRGRERSSEGESRPIRDRIGDFAPSGVCVLECISTTLSFYEARLRDGNPKFWLCGVKFGNVYNC